jgi:beta-lactamase regulating signal transducer with metallopeptidase domain
MQDFLEFRHLPSLFKASWQAAVLILLVLGAQLILGRRLNARWRYGLWLLVLIRLSLPWTVPSPVSLFNCLRFAGGAALTGRGQAAPGVETRAAAPAPASVPEARAGEGPGLEPAPAAAPLGASVSRLLWLWSAGAFLLALCLALTHYRIWKRVTRCRALVNAPVLNLLEDCKQLMGVRTPVTLVETGAVESPSLFGFVRPRLLLPAGLAASFSLEELRYVFLHELGHLKRHDIPTGWVMTALQILHWFNPLVWWGFHRMRADRELACDALALSYAKEEENRSYGRTIIKLLEGFGCSAWAPSLAGTVENKNQMKERIEMIASFKKTNRGPAVAIVLFAGLGLLTLTDARNVAEADGAAGSPPAQPSGGGQSPPGIVATSPEVGASEVDPAQTEITVTFNCDMSGGFSWTGGGPDFPPSPEGRKAAWREDHRTCVLPVKLEAGRYYRLGINSTSYRNFRSAAGTPATPSAICFTTRGASEELKRQMRPPNIIATSPRVGDTEVSPALAEITVTFDQDMGGGFSWTGGGPDYPPSPEGAKTQWRDPRTCVLPVKLEAARYYRVGINSTSFQNLGNAHGVAARPSALYFTTQGASEELKLKARKPEVVSLNPPNDGQNVRPGLTELRVTFNVPMGGGFSWTGGGPEFPDTPEGKRAYWTEDGKTCVLPVQLKPGWTYQLGLNSPWHVNFQSAGGVPLDPVAYTFKTAEK